MAVRRPSKWFRDSVARGRARDTEQDEFYARRKRLSELRENILLARRYFKGFSAREGYSLKPGAIARMSAAKAKRLEAKAREVREVSRLKHLTVRPRSAKSRRALEKHLGLKPDATRTGYVVPIIGTGKARVRVVTPKPKKRKRGQRKSATPEPVVEISEEITPGTERVRRFFYFRDYVTRIATMDDILQATQAMRPAMPKGSYMMVSARHGPISEPTPRDALVQAVVYFWALYDDATRTNTFPSDLVGWVWTAPKIDGAIKIAQRIRTARQLGRENQQRMEREHRARLARRFKL